MVYPRTTVMSVCSLTEWLGTEKCTFVFSKLFSSKPVFYIKKTEQGMRKLNPSLQSCTFWLCSSASRRHSAPVAYQSAIPTAFSWAPVLETRQAELTSASCSHLHFLNKYHFTSAIPLCSASLTTIRSTPSSWMLNSLDTQRQCISKPGHRYGPNRQQSARILRIKISANHRNVQAWHKFLHQVSSIINGRRAGHQQSFRAAAAPSHGFSSAVQGHDTTVAVAAAAVTRGKQTAPDNSWASQGR